MPDTFRCDPALHDGAKVGADYFVQVLGPDGRAEAFGPAFACCADHLLHAVRAVLSKTSATTLHVRRVTGL